MPYFYVGSKPWLFSFKVATDFIYIKASADGEQVIH